MKRLLALIAVLALCMMSFAIAETVTDADLAAAKSYVRMLYKKAAEMTSSDYERIARVPMGDKTYEITWSADHESIKFIDGEMVTVDIDESWPEEISYVLTATITSPVTGETASVSFNHKAPAGNMSYEQILDIAYGLAEGSATEDIYRLYGTVTAIDTAWSDEYQNITVTIQVGDLADKPMMCYRLKGEGAKNLKVGDKITVEGKFKNYKGTIEYDAGCVLVGYGEIVSQANILNMAYKLADGQAMTAQTALAGTIISIDTAWSEQYGNITVTMVCDGKEDQPIMCYRLKGEGAANLAVGQEIGVAGTIKNYKGTIEFDAGCVLVDPAAIADVREVLNAYTIPDGVTADKEITLTGVIHKIPTVWSDEYQNITVDMTIGGLVDYPIECYRLAGEGAATLAIGDTITVTGVMKNYKGLIEFNSGCKLVEVVKPEGAEEVVPPTTLIPATTEEVGKILEAAYALEDGAYMYDKVQLTAKVTEIVTEYSEQYGNISVVIEYDEYSYWPMFCYRLKGEGAATLAVGDTITVEGSIKNYKGTIEYDAGCQLLSVVKAN